VVVACDRQESKHPLARPALGPGTEVWVWPEHDLALIPIDTNDLQFLTAQRPLKKINRGSFEVWSGSQISVYGTSKDNACLDNVSFALDRARVSALIAQLKQSHALDKGSLADDGQLLLYFSSAAEGTSGGPVIVPLKRNGRATEIVGVHDGGTPDGKIAWAILFDGVDWSRGQKATFKGKWPSFVEPGMANSYRSEYTGQVEELLARQDRRFFIRGLGAQFEMEAIGPTRTSWNFIVPSLTFFSELTSWPRFVNLDSFGISGQLGFSIGQFRADYVTQTGTLLDTADVPRLGFVVELDAEIRFHRLWRWRPSLRLGARTGMTAFADPGASEYLGALFGIPLRIRLAISKTSFHSLAIEGALIAAYSPAGRYRYSGVGGDLVDEHPYSWGLVWSLGLGYEY